jgi:diguanylate cyclase (GGDEF)-like protein
LLVGCAAWASPTGRKLRLDGARVLVMPALFGATALGVLVAHAIEPVHPLGLGLAVGAIAAALVRLGVTFSENLRLLEGTTREAYTDSLTGLGNRRRLMEDLERAAADATAAEPCGLVVFDLDGFKQYNDRYGHPMGDALLGRLGHLDACVGSHGRAYRLGGDEFCVIARGTRAELSEIASLATDALSERGRGFDVGCSHGLVLMPEEASDVSHALHVADERLYDQKGSRRREVARTETSSALVQVLREYEPDLHGHLNEVMRLSRSVGQRLGLDEDELFDVIRAAELHDIGKVAVPSAVLQKAGPLDDSEWDFVRQHTLVGDRILSAAPALANVAKLVRASHERYDGMGYPDQTSGREIPIGARIVAVCDAYHAMTSDRPYRPRLDAGEALSELRRCAGAQFDPEVVEIFCELMEAQASASKNGPDPAGARARRLDPQA